MTVVSNRPEEGDPLRAKRGARKRTRSSAVVGKHAQVRVEEAVDHPLPVKTEPMADPPAGGDGGANAPMDALRAWLVEAVGRGVASLSQLSLELHNNQATCPSVHPLRRVAVSDEALLEGLAAAGATEVDGKVKPQPCSHLMSWGW